MEYTDETLPRGDGADPTLPAGKDYRRSKQFAGAVFRVREQLRNARFDGAMLAGVDFTDSDLDRATFRDASLRGAHLSKVKNLSTEALGGADLTGAQLPEGWRFDGLDGVSEASKYLQSLFKIILAMCAFSVLTIFSTPDEVLILRESPHGTKLPFISAAIAPRHFGWIAPLIILTLFVYLVTYLAETWVQLSKLPAVFPDGSPLDRRAYPLSLNCLIRRYSLWLDESPPVHYEIWIAYIFMFGVSLPTLLFFYLAYLKLHCWWISALQALWFAMALQLTIYHRVISIVVLGEKGWRTRDEDWRESGGHPAPWAQKWFPRLFEAARMLITQASGPGKPPEPFGLWRSLVAGPIPVGLCISALAVLALVAFRLPWVRVDIAHKAVSQLVAADGEPLVSGADLEGVDLRNAQAMGVYLRNADLAAAILAGAHLTGADLRGAVLDGADFTGSILDGADFTGAVISGCRFEGSSIQPEQLAQARKPDPKTPPKLDPGFLIAHGERAGVRAARTADAGPHSAQGPP